LYVKINYLFDSPTAYRKEVISMSEPLSYTLVLNIGPDTDPRVIEALMAILELSKEASNLSASECQELNTNFVETEFVTRAMLIAFLEKDRVGGVTQKADTICRYLQAEDGSLRPGLVGVCIDCNKPPGICRCSKYGSAGSEGKWHYNRRPAHWNIGLTSLLNFDANTIQEMGMPNFRRLTGFIEHLRQQATNA
jgi:hypothetical protein